MDKIIDKINKLSLPAAILIASLIIGGFYYASELNKQKYIEKQQEIKIQKEETKTDQAKQEQDKTKQALDTCLATTESNSRDYWYSECKSESRLTDRCISLHNMTFEKYAKQNNILNLQNPQGKSLNLKAIGDFNKEKYECGNCSLPFDNGDRIAKSRQDNKAECFKKYPQK